MSICFVAKKRDRIEVNNTHGEYVSEKQQAHLARAIVICLLGAIFYLYEFVLQVSPNVISNDLMRDLHLQAAGLGLLSASFFYAYMPMMFPAGLLYDRFGPRILLTIMVAVCATGALLFSHSKYIEVITLGRSMMGFGSAFAFIGTLVLVSRWFAAKYFPLMTGIVQAMSSVGAILGTIPLAQAVDQFGWRHSISGLAIAGFCMALAIWAIVRDSPKGHVIVKHQHSQSEWKRLVTVCKKPQTWLVGLYAFTMWAPITVFAELWGVAYLRATYHLGTVNASSYITFIWIGVAIGSPLLGVISQRLRRRCLPLIAMALLGLFAFTIIAYIENLSSFWLYTAMLVFGFSASGCILTFSLVRENNALATVGSAIGFNNMMVVAGGALLQPLVGIILKYQWHGEMMDSVPIYSVNAYRLGLLVIPTCYIVALILARFFINETYCRDIVKD